MSYQPLIRGQTGEKDRQKGLRQTYQLLPAGLYTFVVRRFRRVGAFLIIGVGKTYVFLQLLKGV